MKILVPKTSVPLWGIILGFTCMSLASLLFMAINIYISIAMFVFLNGITWLVIKMAINFDKWKKSTIEKDPFFKQSNFTLASVVWGQVERVNLGKHQSSLHVIICMNFQLRP